MRTYFGNYLGICISNLDPEHRGRVQVFVPHISTTLYEDWNKKGADITIECVGDNIKNSLTSDIVYKLTKVLPWAEYAAPVIGGSTAGSYSLITGNKNYTGYVESQTTQVSLNLSSTPTNFKLPETEQETATRAFNRAYANFLNEGIDAERAKLYASAMMGNMSQETNFNYNLTHDNDTGYGLLGTASRSNDHRLNWMIKFAQERGEVVALNPGSPTSPNKIPGSAVVSAGGISPETQVDFFFKEFKERNPYDPYDGLQNRAYQQLITTNTVDEATIAVSSKFVRPSVAAANNSNRIYQARGFFEKIASIANQNTSPNIAQANSAPDPSQAQPAPTAFSNAIVTEETPLEKMTTGGTQTVSQRFDFAAATGSNYLASGSSTLCGVGTRKIAGTILGVSNWKSVGFGNAKDMDDSDTFLQEGYYGKQPNIQTDSNYKAQQGDILIHNKGDGQYGHAQIFVNGAWHSFKPNDGGYERYFKKSGQTSTLFRLTEKGQNRLKEIGLCDVTNLGAPYTGTYVGTNGPKGLDNNAEIDANQSPVIIKHPTPTFAACGDTTGMPDGAFAVPAPGAMLWVFFREGNPLYPVYFAASYSSSEWSAARGSSSPDIHTPSQDNPTRSQTILKNGGVIELTNTNELAANSGDIGSDKKDYRGVKIKAPSGAYMHWNSKGIITYTPNELFVQADGNSYHQCLNKESVTYGDDNEVTYGDRFVIVGTITDTTLNAVQRMQEIANEISELQLKD